MTWAMESLIALEVGHRAAQMRANCTRHGKPFVAIAKHKYLFLYQECGWPKGKICWLANLEGLGRLIKDARHQEPKHGRETDSDR